MGIVKTAFGAFLIEPLALFFLQSSYKRAPSCSGVAHGHQLGRVIVLFPSDALLGVVEVLGNHGFADLKFLIQQCRKRAGQIMWAKFCNSRLGVVAIVHGDKGNYGSLQFAVDRTPGNPIGEGPAIETRENEGMAVRPLQHARKIVTTWIAAPRSPRMPAD
jgi:hypothetical protein